MGFFKVRLFDKAHDLESRPKAISSLDVPKTGLRGGGDDAKRNQVVGFCQFRGIGNSPVKGILIGDEMVGGKHQHLGIPTMLFSDLQGSHCNRGCRIATHRFQQKNRVEPIRHERARELVLAHEKIVTVGDRQNIPAIGNRLRSVIGLLKQTFSILKSHEWLGIAFAGYGPETGTDAAGENDRNKHG